MNRWFCLVSLVLALTNAWPEWPAESIYSGIAYGPVPFWCKPYGFQCIRGRTYADNPKGQKVKGMLSVTKSVQKIDHEFCNLTNYGGPVEQVRCSEYWLANGNVYIAADNFCCQGYGSPGLFPLRVPQTDWMTSQMKLNDQLGYYKGEFYDGKVYNYTMNFILPRGGGVIHFWYYASYPDKKPVAQGEGCVIDVRYASRCVVNAPVYLFTEYQTFTSVSFTNYTLFDSPPQCKDNRRTDCYNRGGGPPPIYFN